MGKGGGKGCTSRKGGKRQRVDSSSEKKTSAEASATSTSTSIGKQKENLYPENEFVCCGVTVDSACDSNKPVIGGATLVHEGDEDHVILEGDSDFINVTVNHIHPEQHLEGIISHSNWQQVTAP
jgi:flavin reductase (DIM6/NTAB) family NADH-FMN oxidoreductase RutF